jgi:4-amino-4-deoxy-L-arabinose transferase-like glycosyltransferase
LAGLSAIAVLLVLPSGFWMTRLNAEAPMMLGLLLTTWGLLAWRDGRRTGLATAAAGLAWTCLAKPANGVALGIALLAGGALAMAFDAREARLRNAFVSALGAVGLVVWAVTSAALRVPSLTETIQDMATEHFITPDIANPLGYLVHRDLSLIEHQSWPVVRRGWPLLLTIAGLSTLIYRRRWRAFPWIAVGVTGLAAVLAHPLESEYPKLTISLWLPVGAGIGLLVELTTQRLARSRDANTTAAVTTPRV